MKNKAKPLIAVTPGDITGVGPEILVKVLLEGPRDDCRLLVVGDGEVMRQSFTMLGANFNLPVFRNADDAVASEAPAVMLDLAQGGKELLFLRQPHPEAGRLAAEALVKAAELALAKRVDGVVYAPLCKETLNLKGQKYSDEQYILREFLRAPNLRAVAKSGKVFRITIAEHVPLRKVPDLITRESVLNNIELMHEALLLYGIESPRIGVAALNPHAGEHGLIGNEEIEQIVPAIEAARARGIDAQGPIPADTIYVRAFKGQFDGVVNMYHDQANIALKVAGFGEIVIFFVRSPIIITTPSHGTAYGKAGKGLADHNNLKAAIETAASLALPRTKAR